MPETRSLGIYTLPSIKGVLQCVQCCKSVRRKQYYSLNFWTDWNPCKVVRPPEWTLFLGHNVFKAAQNSVNLRLQALINDPTRLNVSKIGISQCVQCCKSVRRKQYCSLNFWTDWNPRKVVKPPEWTLFWVTIYKAGQNSVNLRLQALINDLTRLNVSYIDLVLPFLFLSLR